MKTNRLISYIGLAALAVSVAGCTDSVDYSPAQPVSSPGVYFDEQETAFEIDSNAEAYGVAISRGASDEALTVALEVTGDTEQFTVPSSVSFAAGQSSTTISVTPLVDNMEAFATYTIAIAISDDVTTPYLLNSWEGTFTYSEGQEWISIGEGQFTDDIIASLFSNINCMTWTVEVERHYSTEGLYRIVNPYGCDASYFASYYTGDAENDYLVINATNPSQVYFGSTPGESYSTGIDLGYGVMSFEILSYGTLEDGNITFPVKGVAVYDDDGGYYANQSGEFRIVLPGAQPVIPTESWTSLGRGYWTDGFICPLFQISDAVTYEVEVQEKDNEPGIYRMVNPYTDEFPYGGPADKDYYIEIDATNPDCVLLDMQDTGFATDEDGAIYILNFASNAVAGGNTAEQIIAAGRNDVMADGTITFRKGNCYAYFPETDAEHIYSAQEQYRRDAVLVLPGSAAAESCSTMAKRSPMELAGGSKAVPSVKAALKTMAKKALR